MDFTLIAVAVIASVAPIATVLTARRAAKTAVAAKEQVEEIHVLVNSRLSAALEELDMARKALRSEKVKVKDLEDAQ